VEIDLVDLYMPRANKLTTDAQIEFYKTVTSELE